MGNNQWLHSSWLCCPLPLPKPLLSEVKCQGINRAFQEWKQHRPCLFHMSFQVWAVSSPLTGGQPCKLEQDSNTDIIIITTTIIVFSLCHHHQQLVITVHQAKEFLLYSQAHGPPQKAPLKATAGCSTEAGSPT